MLKKEIEFPEPILELSYKIIFENSNIKEVVLNKSEIITPKDIISLENKNVSLERAIKTILEYKKENLEKYILELKNFYDLIREEPSFEKFLEYALKEEKEKNIVSNIKSLEA